MMNAPPVDSRRARLRRVRALLALFAAALALSGATALFLPSEARALVGALWGDAAPGTSWAPALHAWLARCRDALADVGTRHPFLYYGTDWLAFAHFVLAILFLGAARDPVRNVWAIQFGLICCAGVVLFAAVAAPLRGVPWVWVPVDAAFGVFGAVPLLLALRDIRHLEASR